MAWSDNWKYIRYGVATLVGMAATVGLYVTWTDMTTEEYITTEEYAAVLLGTVERCMATATGVSIETNTVTNVVFDYVADPSGRMWTPTGGTPTNYLVPVYVTNVDAVVSTNWTYAVDPPAIVSVERVTVGRVISGFQTNYHDTNGVLHKSPPSDPSTNPTWEVVSIYTNDSPAVLTNTFTNVITAYIPTGIVQTLQGSVESVLPYYSNTNTTGLDGWTVTGMFYVCGFTNGWDTNAGPQYISKTNFVQLYTVLSMLRERRDTDPITITFERGDASWDEFQSDTVTNAYYWTAAPYATNLWQLDEEPWYFDLPATYRTLPVFADLAWTTNTGTSFGHALSFGETFYWGNQGTPGYGGFGTITPGVYYYGASWRASWTRRVYWSYDVPALVSPVPHESDVVLRGTVSPSAVTVTYETAFGEFDMGDPEHGFPVVFSGQATNSSVITPAQYVYFSAYTNVVLATNATGVTTGILDIGLSGFAVGDEDLTLTALPSPNNFQLLEKGPSGFYYIGRKGASYALYYPTTSYQLWGRHRYSFLYCTNAP